MNLQDLINNNWFISIVSSLITLLVVPLINFLYNFIKSRYGVFSGNYIAITNSPDTGHYIFEFVKCNHIKNNLKGRIYGIAFAQKTKDLVEINKQHKEYVFSGNVTERLFVISYRPIEKGNISLGTIALYGNAGGKIFTGIWSGLEEGEVVSESCVWYKCSSKLSYRKDYDKILEEAENFVKGDVVNPMIITMENHSAKSNTMLNINLPFRKQK